MHDYRLVANASESRERNLNSLMQHFGISYQLVRSPVIFPSARIHRS